MPFAYNVQNEDQDNTSQDVLLQDMSSSNSGPRRRDDRAAAAANNSNGANSNKAQPRLREPLLQNQPRGGGNYQLTPEV